ncbi:hypothetical protein [Rhizobium sp. S96]|uniref:hypothetical protein n=1 Tax=Rhizobium sp. S96 TaxID=3055140 RepID=UPI0025AAEB1C|nr:hypothetical protein [Rhizobium sp. S96]MDM9621115.1 hypothetical protein [Rhizobium sp. S96]
MVGGLHRLVSALGTKSVQVWEWDKNTVLKPRLANKPNWHSLANPRRQLTFSGWQLAHAVAKADHMVKANLFGPSLGFLLQAHHVIDSASSNLRIIDNLSGTLNEIALSGLSARIAQGISLLFANQREYVFAGHLASDPAVPKNTKAADFIFEDASKGRMILESKGSFSMQANDPSKVKTILKAALEDQVQPWLAKISPPASKGFVTYSCIREKSQSTDSAVIFVDPPGEADGEQFDIEPSWVRRRNYGAWFDAMGLPGAGDRLRRTDRASMQAVTLPVFVIGPYKFALMLAWTPYDGGAFVGYGIEVSILRGIERALAGDESFLLDFEGLAFGGFGEEVFASDVARQWSLMPDGTFFGSVNPGQFVQFEVFKL